MEAVTDPWKFFKEVDFSDESVLQYNVDTRDFHVSCMTDSSKVEIIDTHKLEKYPERFFHTHEEVLNLLDRYYIESGGRAKWRFFSLVGVDNWSMKYIRIQRTSHGLVVCNSDLRALNRDILEKPVDKTLLHDHD